MPKAGRLAGLAGFPCQTFALASVAGWCGHVLGSEKTWPEHSCPAGSDVPNVGHALKTNTVLCWLKKHIVIAQAQGRVVHSHARVSCRPLSRHYCSASSHPHACVPRAQHGPRSCIRRLEPERCATMRVCGPRFGGVSQGPAGGDLALPLPLCTSQELTLCVVLDPLACCEGVHHARHN